MRLVIIGAGEHGAVVADAARSNRSGPRLEIVGFLDDDEGLHGVERAGCPVLGGVELLATVEADAAIVAIGDNQQRRRIFATVADILPLFSVVHQNAVISELARVGNGTFVGPGVVVTARTEVGDNVILNTSCSVDHDSTVENHAHIGPGARLGGRIRVGEGSLVGIGAIVRSGATLGAWATVGAGSLVLKDVADGAIVAGSPARPLEGPGS